MDAREGLRKLHGYAVHVLTWVDADGYPVNVAVHGVVEPEAGTVTLTPPAGLAIPDGALLSVTGSHIRPVPGYGYDQRRHVTVWGHAMPTADGRLRLTAERAWGWDEAEVHFGEYSERGVAQSRRYFEDLSRELGRPVKPRLALGWLFLRSTRLPFLTAALVPALLGVLIAAANGFADVPAAILTLVGAATVHLGANVANDVFDARSGADDANVNPTQFSGGSRVIQYGLLSDRAMFGSMVLFLGIGAGIGLLLLATRFSVPLLVIGVVGLVVAVGYTAPPLKLVYRGLGEIAIAIGFGPLMLLGAYVVQSRGSIAPEAVAASIPVAILVALILYANEIPDRHGDARAGKRTIPVRLPQRSVIALYGVFAALAFLAVIGSVMLGYLPLPAILALLAAPLAWRVYSGLERTYDKPYVLMSLLGTNVKLHLYVGLALIAAYVIVLLAGAVAPGVRLFLR